jgi:hypothetical protein
LCERRGISDGAKRAILRNNAGRFYGFRGISN